MTSPINANSAASITSAATATALPTALPAGDSEFDSAHEPALPAALVPHAVQRVVNGEPDPAVTSDTVAAEVPVALVFNGISHAVMMATPRDLHAFAVGFALSEGVIDSLADLRDIETRVTPADCDLPAGVQACEVHLDISAGCFARLKEKRRSLAGRTGCGVCGIDSLQMLDLLPERVAQQPWMDSFGHAAIQRAMAAMPALQQLNAEAGSLHAAAWATPDGEVTDVLEDVGRHNALDKLLGKLALEKRLGTPGFVLMSSRASYELVRKCARLDVPVLATISAPTALAIRIAEQAGLQLWGLCRGPRAVRYVPAGRS